MKEYPKRYEDVYSSDRSLRKCDLRKVTTDVGMSIPQYKKLFLESVIDFENKLFDTFLKIVWLRGRFCYDGIRISRESRNGFYADGAFGVFMRHHVGVDPSEFSFGLLPYIKTYIRSWFPDFNEVSPFERELKYPYKHVRFSHLFTVYQMEERMDLIEYAEKNKMLYPHFVDYVINYVSCLNEEKGEQWYRLGHMYNNKNLYVINEKGVKPYEA